MTGTSRLNAVLVLLVTAGGGCGPGEGPAGSVDADAGPDGTGGAEAGAPDMPAATSVVRFGLQAGGQAASLPATAGGIVIDSAVFALHELTVASDTGTAKIEGSWPLDLASGMATLDLRAVRPGLYSRMVIKLEHLEGNVTAPPVFQGQRLSAHVSGTLSSGVAFAVRMTSEVAIELSAAAPFDLPTGGRLNAQVRFDLGRWFSGISFPEGPGPIVVDATSNPELLSRFRANLAQSASLTFD